MKTVLRMVFNPFSEPGRFSCPDKCRLDRFQGHDASKHEYAELDFVPRLAFARKQQFQVEYGGHRLWNGEQACDGLRMALQRAVAKGADSLVEMMSA